MRGVTKRRVMFSVAGFLLAVSLFGAAPVAAAGDTGRGTVDSVTPGGNGDAHDRAGLRDGGDRTLTPDVGNLQNTLFTGAVGVTAWDLITRYGDPNNGAERPNAGFNKPDQPTRGSDLTLRD
jgi:hypothetical protein